MRIKPMHRHGAPRDETCSRLVRPHSRLRVAPKPYSFVEEFADPHERDMCFRWIERTVMPRWREIWAGWKP